jgi:hypothetical protein
VGIATYKNGKTNFDWNLGYSAIDVSRTGGGGSANLYFSGGPQWNMSEHIIFSALIGTAVGHNSPDLTGTLEFAFAF